MNSAALRLGVDWDYDSTRSDMRYYESTLIATGALKKLPGTFSIALLPHNRQVAQSIYVFSQGVTHLWLSFFGPYGPQAFDGWLGESVVDFIHGRSRMTRDPAGGGGVFF